MKKRNIPKGKLILTVNTGISSSDVQRLLTLEYFQVDGTTINNVCAVEGKRVGGNTYPGNKVQEAFCERMCHKGLMNTVVSDWGNQETEFVITDLGRKAIQAIKKSY